MPFSSILEDSKALRNESVIAREYKLPKLKKKRNNLKKAVRTEHSESFGQNKIINPIHPT